MTKIIAGCEYYAKTGSILIPRLVDEGKGIVMYTNSITVDLHETSAELFLNLIRLPSPEERECPSCEGQGLIGDYVGLEMRCVGAECDRCKGTGHLPTPVEPKAQSETCGNCDLAIVQRYRGTKLTWVHSGNNRMWCSEGGRAKPKLHTSNEVEPKAQVSRATFEKRETGGWFPKAQVESASVEEDPCKMTDAQYEAYIYGPDRAKWPTNEPKEVESGEGLPELPPLSSKAIINDGYDCRLAYNERTEQLQASLLREKRQADRIAYLEQHNQFLAANLNLFKEEVERLKELLKSAVTIARDAYQAWNCDQDMKCGKILLALAGSNRGYRADTDAIQAAVTGEWGYDKNKIHTNKLQVEGRYFGISDRWNYCYVPCPTTFFGFRLKSYL